MTVPEGACFEPKFPNSVHRCCALTDNLCLLAVWCSHTFSL
uniref:Uncharacterized protein n=1 Tax=Anopheles albimanus TaxID=7167 RepID=A0A182FZA6_ANOAL